jgi:hypothetical protein
MNDFKPLVIKVTAPVASQGTAFAQKQHKGAGTPGSGSECSYNKEYFANKECRTCGKKGHPRRCCNQKKGKTKKGTDDEKLVSSSKSNKTIKSLTKQVKTLKKLVSMLQAHNKNSKNDSSISSKEGDAHFQCAWAAIASTNPNVAMALKSPKAWDLDLRSVWLLDSQSTFDLCCNPDFAAKMRKAKQALNMSSNDGGLYITKECMVLANEFWMWFTKRAMNNIICLKNIIRLYRVT